MKDKIIGAIILAAGRGKRMQMYNANKVTLSLGNKPMILYTVSLLEKLKIHSVVVVVGFAKRSVMDALKDSQVMFVEQKKRLGTAHAVSCGLKELPLNIKDVLILQGDDSAFYKEEVITNLIKTHYLANAAFTFLTIELDNPYGLGRVVRDKEGRVKAVVEEKDATGHEREIKEVNPACYIFRVSFLKEYLKEVKKSSVTGEYYLTSLIDIAIKNKEKIETLQSGAMPWRGINTKEELDEAQKLLLLIKK